MLHHEPRTRFLARSAAFKAQALELHTPLVKVAYALYTSGLHKLDDFIWEDVCRWGKRNSRGRLEESWAPRSRWDTQKKYINPEGELSHEEICNVIDNANIMLRCINDSKVGLEYFFKMDIPKATVDWASKQPDRAVLWDNKQYPSGYLDANDGDLFTRMFVHAVAQLILTVDTNIKLARSSGRK